MGTRAERVGEEVRAALAAALLTEVSDPRLSMATVTATGAGMPDSWTVESALPIVRTVDAAPATVSPGGAGYPVSVSVENGGLNPLVVGCASFLLPCCSL